MISNSGRISLVDWRHEFGSSNLFGDLYYDLAKLYGGIILNYSRIKDNDFECELINQEDIKFTYVVDQDCSDHVRILKEFILSLGLSFHHCKKLLSLIFINMAPLHEKPFDLLLLALSNQIHLDANQNE